TRPVRSLRQELPPTLARWREALTRRRLWSRVGALAKQDAGVRQWGVLYRTPQQLVSPFPQASLRYPLRCRVIPGVLAGPRGAARSVEARSRAAGARPSPARRAAVVRPFA